MNWVTEAHEEITTRKMPRIDIYYSGRFKSLNANVRYGLGWMEFRLAKEWKDVDEEIRKGLVQHLLCKVYGLKRRTMSIEMYEEYLRQSSNYAKKGASAQELVERFHALNDEYFHGMMEAPTLRWGQHSTSKLGSYDYASDTVTISTALKDDQDLLDYVLYHELLHKKHKFKCSGAKTHHHTKAFRDDERKFKIPDAEKRLENYLMSKRSSRKKGWFW